MNPRIFNELKILYQIFKNITIVGLSDFKCQITIMDDKYQYKFIVLSTYPFTPPIEILINNIPYSKYLKVIRAFMPILKKHYGIDCLCCTSLNCISNWTTSLSLIKIIDEFKENLIVKKNIQMIYFCKMIKHKYNCEFAEIELYIF